MRVILVEFNELSPQLMQKFMAAGKLPNFQRFYGESEVYETQADDDVHLEPWIQWIAVHSGIPFAQHGIEHLGEGTKLEQENVWDLASSAGKKVWVCGSMNISYRQPINGWVLPDPWNAKARPHPEELEPFYRFVAANVQEHTREDSPLSRAEQAEFLRFMARHGLSLRTVAAIVRQLLSERTSESRWKRAVLLDRLQFDLFRWHWQQQRPDLSTFFLNSTAHYQHLYWRNMEPEHFKIRPEPGEQAVYEDAILYGYVQMDRICGQLMQLAGDDVALVFLTALSQQPCLTYEEIGGKVIYRPLDFDAFLSEIGLEHPIEVTPIMAEDFLLEFESEEAARAAEITLRAVTLSGEPALGAQRSGSEIKCGCRIWKQVDPDAVLELDGAGRTVPFFDLLYQIDLVKSGEHNPVGMMWVRTPERRHSVAEQRIPLVSVAPTVLEMLGVEAPDYMTTGETIAT